MLSWILREGEASRQVRLPQSFTLSEVRNTPSMAPIPQPHTTRASSVPSVDVGGANPLLGAARALCDIPLFRESELAALGVSAGDVLRLAATLCDTGGVMSGSFEVGSVLPVGDGSMEPRLA